jgi:hypothetical protein
MGKHEQDMPDCRCFSTPAGRAIVHILTCAVVSRRFRILLLCDPARALHEGYEGETFALSAGDKSYILRIQAGTLAELAQQLLSRYVSQEPEYHKAQDASPTQIVEDARSALIKTRHRLLQHVGKNNKADSQ